MPFDSSISGVLKNAWAKDSVKTTFPLLSIPSCVSDTSEWPSRKAAVENSCVTWALYSDYNHGRVPTQGR